MHTNHPKVRYFCSRWPRHKQLSYNATRERNVLLIIHSSTYNCCYTYSSFTPPTRQDYFVLSCPCQRCEHNFRQDQTVLSCLDPVSNFQVFSNPHYIWNWTGANWKLGWDKTKLSCLVASCVHPTDTDKTRQDNFVLSVSAVWTSYKCVVCLFVGQSFVWCC